MKSESAGKLPEDSKRHSFSKSDARYWAVPGRLFKDHGVPDYSCRFSVRGERAQVCLNTPNQKKAAKLAAELFELVSREGWEVGLALYRPVKAEQAPEKVTVGMLIEAATTVSSARPQTLNVYAKSFRLIVSEIHEIGSDGKFDAYQGGLQNWRAKVDAVPIELVTPAAVLSWKNKRLRSCGSDPLARRRSVVTVNSLIRNAKALFGKKLLPFIEQSISLPQPLPFDGIAFEKEPSLRYISKIDPFALLTRAREELAEADSESFKVLVLALICGLRRGEIDNLLWKAFDFRNSVLRIESSEYHELKSEESAGRLDLDADTCGLFKAYRAEKPRAVFVVGSSLKHKATAKTGRYRCNPVFRKVLAWLRKNGVEAHKPLHTLRKEIGSIIASEHGIFAASRYLRHADIHITSAYYADKKGVVTPLAFEGLLGSQNQAAGEFIEGESGAGEQGSTGNS